MDSQKLKGQIFSGLLAVSIPAVSAQSPIGENQGIEASLLEFMNTILLFEVESAAGVLLYFLAPMAGFYFVQKNMLSYGFELFEERIDRHSYRRTDDDIPDGIKGLSIVTGFITVQMLGNISAGILLATGLISILLAVVMQLGLLEGFGGDGGGRDRNRNTGGNAGNQQNQGGGQQNQNGGGGGINWGNVGQTAANFANTAQQYQENRQNQSIKGALSVFNTGTDVINLIDKEPSDFRNHIQDIRSARKNDAGDVNSLEEVLDRLEHIESECEDLVDAMGDDVGDANRATGPGPSFDWGTDSEIRNKVDGWDIIDKLRNLREELKRIKKDQKNTASGLQDQLDSSWDDIQVYIKIHQFAEKLPKSPQRLANDNDLLNELVSEAMDRNQVGGRGSGRAKNEFRDALNKIDRYEQAHKNLISDFESELQNELKLDQTESDDLKKISSDDDKIREAAKRTKNGIETIENDIAPDPNIDLSTGSPDPSTVKSQLDIIKQLGRQIENEIQDIHSIVQSEGEFENDTYQKLKQLK